jgi:hypothetical protein
MRVGPSEPVYRSRFQTWGVAVLVIIGVTLIVLAPAKQSGERVSAAVV